jgi:hypothetical protein
MENFNLKKFLVENKLTTNSKMLNEGVLEDFVADIAKLKEPGPDEFDLDARGYIKDGKVTVYLDSNYNTVTRAVNKLVKTKYADTIRRVRGEEDNLVYALKKPM